MEIDSFGYDSDGIPIDFIDSDGVEWIYQGKSENGADNLYGCY